MIVDNELMLKTYGELKQERQLAINEALKAKPQLIAERLEAEKQRIAEEVHKEIVAEASQPFDRDIELIEKFLKEEQVEVEEEHEEEEHEEQ